MTEQVPEVNFDDIFRPPPGGDITLRSSDGVEFLVHSVVLGVASSIFEGLLMVGTKKDVVELSENAEALSLTLRFIYPNKKTPIITSFDMLSLCLHAAQKYDLEGMLETLDDQLVTKEASQSLLHHHPLLTYELALQFDLPHTRALAMSLVVTGEIDFSDPVQLSGLVQYHPSASVIRLAAIQSTRGKMLADVLFRFYKTPMVPTYNMFYMLSCESCRNWLDECGLQKQNPPSWIIAWADLAYETLLRAPLEKSDELFGWSILDKFKGEDRVCQQCLGDFQDFPHQGKSFDHWAQGVRGVLEQHLDDLQHLRVL